MNDGYHAPPAAARPHDHPLLQQGRRQTRGMKFLGKDAFGAGTLSVFDWHILLKLSHSSGGLNPSELARFFTAPTNTMSSALLRLERQKLIKRQKVMTDGRLSLVTLADAGFEALQHIEDVVTKLLTESLSDFSNEELADFVALFVRFAGSAAESEVVLQPRLTMRTLEDEEERLDARAFLVEQLVRTGHARSVRERVIAKDSFTWTLMADGEVKGVCEFGEIGAKAYLLHFTLSQPLQNSTAEETFLRAGLARFLDKSSAREVVVSDIHMDSTLLTRLKAETRNGETILSRIAI
jgi:DNA-binding MarR family transcriptional regulator